ncbi:pseudouridine synthase [Nesterenkonia jeotgali]|uniref:Pseudouridine synthase n=1 Tax=Nesterenkonia jeotgali TaxID=317018 RepID=A0A839FR09_9MICC|nr:pseudouridine synthase [Nesterenkonia jeotgali]MBA8920373.1 pseudouridine synthase [Nesterenkonia jeotgali]
MKSSGPDRRAREAQRREPRAATAARTPKAGQTGGPFSSEDPQRMISTGPRRAKPRRDEAEENFAEVHDPEGVRLQKVLAQAGVASRRVCEALISEGRVAVDGKVIIEPGIRVQPEKVAIHVDGVRIQLSVEHQYVMFNKPAGVVTTMSDPHGRPCINDYLTEEMKAARLFHVGRLDAETEGLLLLTNDGELANRLTHPSYEVPKTYVVEVAGPVFKEVGKKLRAGIELEDGPIAVDDYRQLGSDGRRTMIQVTLHSGRNRIVRRIFDHVGHPVLRLVRTALGEITIGDQQQGTVRPLGRLELGHLLELTSRDVPGSSGDDSRHGDVGGSRHGDVGGSRHGEGGPR